MAITDNTKILIKVCKYYFKDGLSQKEISARLSISRPQISRILAHAKEANLVAIRINDPYEKESELECAITKKYGITDAVVLKTTGDSDAERLSSFAKQAALQLEAYLPDKSSIGVMSGKTLCAVVSEVSHLDRKGVSVVPLIGGDGFSGSDWHANMIAQNLAKKAGGQYYFLNAPVVMGSKEAADIIKKEPTINEVINKGTQCSVALVGIGNINETSTSGRASNLTPQEMNVLKNYGAAALTFPL